MDEHQRLAEQFEAQRTRMRALAYRMLGSLNETDAAVQEAWLHLSRSDTSGIQNLGGWLTTLSPYITSTIKRFREYVLNVDAEVPSLEGAGTWQRPPSQPAPHESMASGSDRFDGLVSIAG